jgi:hypothetical protein
MFTVKGGSNCIFPDRLYIKLRYEMYCDDKLDLVHPKTFSDKLNWMKLYNRQPEYTMMVDKYLVKNYVAKKIGSELVVPLIDVWDRADDIDFSKLPMKYVLKCNHVSNVIIYNNGRFVHKSGNEMSQEGAVKLLNQQMKENYYRGSREWPYKNIRRKIICEKYIEKKNDEINIDFKCYCFNGKVKLIQRIEDILCSSQVTCDYFDENWNLVHIQNPYRNQPFVQVEKPSVFDDMIKYAETLAKGIPFVRVDFMVWGNRIFFGEMTFFDWAGFIKFTPDEWNYKLGDWITLPTKKRR